MQYVWSGESYFHPFRGTRTTLHFLPSDFWELAGETTEHNLPLLSGDWCCSDAEHTRRTWASCLPLCASLASAYVCLWYSVSSFIIPSSLLVCRFPSKQRNRRNRSVPPHPCKKKWGFLRWLCVLYNTGAKFEFLNVQIPQQVLR